MTRELDELERVIAEYALRPGERRIITQELLGERCLHYMDRAKKELDAQPH